MIDPITAPSTVNRFDGLLDGTQATALRFVYHTMTLEPSAGQFEMPSGRMVSDHDPEYLDWFFASAWGTTRKAAAWLGVPEPLFVAACAVVVSASIRSTCGKRTCWRRPRWNNAPSCRQRCALRFGPGSFGCLA